MKWSSRNDETVFTGGAQPADAAEKSSVLLETAHETAYLVVAKGPDKGREVALHMPVTLIGRDSQIDLCLADPGASRRHAAILNKEGRFALRDLGSTNGTWLNGVLRGTSRELADGDRFRIGQTEIIFRDPAHPRAESEPLIPDVPDLLADHALPVPDPAEWLTAEEEAGEQLDREPGASGRFGRMDDLLDAALATMPAESDDPSEPTVPAALLCSVCGQPYELENWETEENEDRLTRCDACRGGR